MAKILIVDDDPDILEACQLFLAKAGHEIETAGSRTQGMAKVASFQPDLLVLDVMMDQPDDGFVMAQDLRRQGKTFPILMLTSVSSASGLDFGRDNEMVPVDDFQSKPIEPLALVQRVAQLLQKK